MKFVALALALLLAVGSQAASLQADAPSQLAHARAAVDVYMTQVKDSINRALSQLDGTEYAYLKASLSQHVEDLQTQLKSAQAVVAPMTDSVYGTLSDATEAFRTSITTDIDNLRLQTEADCKKFVEVLTSHIEDYRTQLEPVIRDYSTRHTAEMEALKTKMEPIIATLSGKISTNVEETKLALLPIMEAVRVKLSERLQDTKNVAGPYIEEYKEQIRAAASQVQHVSADELNTLREKLAPLAEEVKNKMQAIFEAIAETVTKH